MRTYKIYGTGAATANNVANILVGKSGRIKSIRWSARVDAVADNSVAVLELSMSPQAQSGTNDTTSEIAEVSIFGNLATSGFVHSSLKAQELVDIPIAQGERVYLHVAITTATYYATAFVDVDESGR